VLLIGWGLLSLSNLLNAKKPDWQAASLFTLKSNLASDLDGQVIPKGLREAFQNAGKSLSTGASDVSVSVDETSKLWTVSDTVRGEKFRITLVGDDLQVSTTGLSAMTYSSIVYGVPIALGFIAAWGVFMLYNWPRFADFLIATEAEMTKVSWSSKSELKRATAVVLITLFLLAGFLFSVDMVWSWFLERIGVLKVAKPTPEQVLLDLNTWRAAWDSLACAADSPPGRS
jgi:preprotein translocase SecE subunit